MVGDYVVERVEARVRPVVFSKRSAHAVDNRRASFPLAPTGVANGIGSEQFAEQTCVVGVEEMCVLDTEISNLLNGQQPFDAFHVASFSGVTGVSGGAGSRPRWESAWLFLLSRRAGVPLAPEH
jgi:hypothetical protein